MKEAADGGQGSKKATGKGGGEWKILGRRADLR